MSKTIQIAMGWLLLPLVAWLGLWVYSSAIAPVEAMMLGQGLTGASLAVDAAGGTWTCRVVCVAVG